MRGVDLALALVNTVDMLNTPPDFLVNSERLGRFLQRAGYPQSVAHLTEKDLDAVRALRTRLTTALDSEESEAAVILNELLAESGATPRAVQGPDGWQLEYGPDPAFGPAFLPAATALPLLQLLVSGGWGRLGRCAASPCCCAFIDRSPGRERKYCCKLCSDRVNQSNYRRRRSSASR